MNNRTGTCCRHCDADLPRDRVSAGTTICVRCEAAKDGPPSGSAYMLAQDTIARLRTDLAAATRRAESAMRAVEVLADECYQRHRGINTKAIMAAVAARQANPIAAAAIERARGGSNGE